MAAVRPSTPFIGRGWQLERLRELLSGAVAGTSAAALLAGDAGVGKTRLVTEFARQAREAGALVLTGRNVDLGSGGLPYLPFSEALAQVLREGRPEQSTGDDDASARSRAARDAVLKIASMRPTLGRLTGRGDQPAPLREPGDADLDRLALFEAVAETLSRVAVTVAPLVLVIEDLHWAEQSTRDLLRFLLSRLGSDPLLIVATYRAEDLHRRHPVRALLAELVRLPSVELIELPPFDQAELSDFLASIHGARLPVDVVARIGERSAGNAYFAEELLSASSGDDRLPAALADVLIDRLERLPAATQQLVRVASVIGSFRIEDRLLRAAAVDGAGLSADDATLALRDAVAHQVLLSDEGDRFGFRHALIQEAVYADLLPGERVRLHATVARLLAQRGASSASASVDAAEQARHSLAAHDLPQALAASLRAARAATARLAPAEALDQYEEALQLWPVVDPGQRPPGTGLMAITLAAAEAAGDAGLRERAVALAETAVEAALESTALENTDGESTGGESADRESPDGESTGGQSMDGEPRDGGSGDGEPRGGGSRGPEPGLVSQARAQLAIHLYAMDNMPRVMTVARQVIAAHPGTQDGGAAHEPTPALVWARGILARALYSVADADGALEVVRPGLAEARALGLRAAQADLEMTWSGVNSLLGQPGADEHLKLAQEAAAASGDRSIMIRVAYAGVVDRFEEGDLDDALRLIGDSLDLAERAGLSNSLYAIQCRWMLVNAHWMRGAPDEALAVVRTGMRELPSAGARQLQHAALPILAARAPQECLDWARALDEVRTNAFDDPPRWAARAEGHAWLGELERSVECSGTAIDVLETLGEPYLLMGIAMSTNAVAVLADLAAAARSAGDAVAARHAVDRAERFLRDARDRARYGRPRRFRMGPEGRAWLTRLDAEELRLNGVDAAADGASPGGGRAGPADGASAGAAADSKAVRAWRAAVEAFGFGAIYEQTRCRWRLAACLLASGDRDGARAQLAQARSSAQALGARPLLAALDDLARRGRLEAAAGPAPGGRLTARERDVMRLVAQGLTNRAIGEQLFISEKTASVHVSNVLAKLGASGRTEAVAIATRDGLLT